MTPFKFVLLWLLIGAVFRIAVRLHGRHKYGRCAADAAIRISLGRWWMLKIFSSCITWPIAVLYLIIRPKPSAADLNAYVEHMKDHCPDCGELLEEPPP